MQIKIFENEEFGRIRTVMIDNEPWFVGKDVSDILGYAQTSNMLKRIDREDFISSKMDDMNMKVVLINESGFYSAVLGSKMSGAKAFRKWVTSEVLPTIRRTGGYVADEEKFAETYLPFLDEPYKNLFKLVRDRTGQTLFYHTEKLKLRHDNITQDKRSSLI